MIWDSSHKYHFFMRREIFTVIFPRCKFPSYRWISPENYPYYGENTFSKKKLQLRKNYESYARILQSVPIILKHTLVACGVASFWGNCGARPVTRQRVQGEAGQVPGTNTRWTLDGWASSDDELSYMPDPPVQKATTATQRGTLTNGRDGR